MSKPQDQNNNDKFSITKTIQNSQIMPKALKDKPNKNRVVLIVVLVLLPILIGIISFLSSG